MRTVIRDRAEPSHALRDALAAAGHGTRLLWEIPGPKDTLIEWLSCYLIGHSICIVQTFKGTDGWNVLTPPASLDIDATIKDVLERCAIKGA